jgi:hypothetical protein
MKVDLGAISLLCTWFGSARLNLILLMTLFAADNVLRTNIMDREATFDTPGATSLLAIRGYIH